ncbi:hypothetical protein SAMN05660420_00172 [Desulfuromusa kysingii]|uniref:Hook-length control protein FliK n=1 Tax=Desulfuromusa kysingii TaxID=37625 RepID=A0A1H3VPY3_9BACT|nr:flagellar hook-length control protein FliK [Desulfuromusa kysingii]SDZ76168.1 hypothetical protein SAMN05660420_00172 [Desulfuromusa kysingii]
MTTVNSKIPANLFVVSPAVSSGPVASEAPGLNLGQMLQGVVVRRELDRVVLEVDRQLYLARGEKELQVGQKVNLQVLQTQPHLEFQVLADSVSSRLNQSLPLLTRPFDWNQLVAQLQQLPQQEMESVASKQVYHQLQQLLPLVPAGSAQIEAQIDMIVAQLKQLLSAEVGQSSGVSSPAPPSQQIVFQGDGQRISAGLSPVFMGVIKALQGQLSLLPQRDDGAQLKNWYATTRKLLAPLHQVPQLLAPQRQLLVSVLRQLQQHPQVSPQLSGEVEQILVQIERQVATETSVVAGELKQPVISGSEAVRAIPSPQESANVATLSTAIKQLLSQVQQAQDQRQGVSPELLGRLEGLHSRLQPLSQTFPGFDMMIGQLEQLIAQRPSAPQGGQLGVLSQLFGVHLEAELLRGKDRDALHSLKLSLLKLQQDFGGDVKEPLHRIELFQLCKAKLAEEQVTFLPLPFNELEEGYLLAEKQSREDCQDEDGEPPLQMSLSLRLSALGNVRIDMLYEKQRLHLRLAGEDQEKMSYLRSCADELKESLEAVELQGVSFGANAELPARQLQQRLLPESFNMLDERL